MNQITIDELLQNCTIYPYPRFYNQYRCGYDQRLARAFILLCIINPELAENVLYMNDHKGHLTVAARYFKDDAKKHIERAWQICGECYDNTSFYSIQIETR